MTRAEIHRCQASLVAGGKRAAPSSLAGFTLVEIIVVIIIIGVVAGVTVPRMVGGSARSAKAEAESVQRLLTTAAERDTYVREPLAIEYSSKDQTLTILTRRQLQRGWVWAPERVLNPAYLGYTRISGAWENGRGMPRDQWRVTFNQTEQRPLLEVQVESLAPDSEGRKQTWTYTLAPDASGAAPADAAASTSIDLDLTGRGDKPW